MLMCCVDVVVDADGDVGDRTGGEARYLYLRRVKLFAWILNHHVDLRIGSQTCRYHGLVMSLFTNQSVIPLFLLALLDHL